VVASAGGGLCLLTASSPTDVWPLALVGVVLALLALNGRRAGSAFLMGAAFGAAFWYPHIFWATEFLGPVPWAALSTLMTLWAGAGAILITLAYRWVPRAWTGAAGRLLLLPAIVAGLWTLREGVSSTWPYGGFSWGRVAFTQAHSPLTPLFSWVGVAGVTFLIVFLAALIIEAVREVRPSGLLRAAVVVLVAVLLVGVPRFPTTETGTLRVGAVQGNPKSGYFDPPKYIGDILRAQLAASEPIVDDHLDVMLWPEGSSDLDPNRDVDAAGVFDALSRRIDAPVIAATVTAHGGKYFNTSFEWVAGKGMVDHYDKRHPVPFGEYIPDRAFWRPFAPELIDLVQREYTPGTTDAVMDIAGKAIAGISICFDIVDDQLIRDTVDQGAQVIFAQTNNADFVGTDENLQQLAIARIRAVETGRAVVNISTVGTSGVILPDGSVVKQGPINTPYTIVMDVPLQRGSTPAVLLGRQLEQLAAGTGLLGLLLAFALTRSRRPGARQRRRG
jgi:apolipoprotein N-acyltransferase